MCQYIIDEQALDENIRIIQNFARDVPVWAVVKGNGYGLGVTELGRRMFRQGITRFCVSEVGEARALRQMGFPQIQILMLQPTSDEAVLAELLKLDVICTISSREDGAALSQTAGRIGKQARAHVKIDTGMGRYGFLPEETEQIAAIYQQLDRVTVTGIYTHFSDAVSSYEKTKTQFRRFHYLVDALLARGIRVGQAHCCNSAAFLKYPEMRMDGVRIGSAFLGRMPYLQIFGLQRVGFCEARVEELHVVERGVRIGYGGAWRARRRTQLAIIPVGWYHGFTAEYQRDCFRFRDCLRGCLGWIYSWLRRRRYWVQINGKSCPVCGHAGMLYTAVDVTGQNCRPGDLARLDISPLEQKGMEVVYR